MTKATAIVESQINKFREIAKELECDESEETFSNKLRKLTKKPDDKGDSKPAQYSYNKIC